MSEIKDQSLKLHYKYIKQGEYYGNYDRWKSV